MNLGQSLRDFRKSRGVSQTEFGQIAGGFSKSAVSQWESGLYEPSIKAIELLARHFGVMKSEILGEYFKQSELPDGAIGVKVARGVWIPVYGSISAGTPMEMIETKYQAEAPETIVKNHPHAFYLKVSGDSMNKEILDGSLVMVDPDQQMKNGDTVVVNINGFDAALKIYNRTANTLILSPNSTNPEHKDIVIDTDSPAAEDIRIIGVKVWAMYPHKDMINENFDDVA